MWTQILKAQFDTDFTPERQRTDEVNFHRFICG
jgi:hypothetical protein